MTTILKMLPFVKQQADFHHKKAEEFQRSARGTLHKKTADKFDELVAAIEELRTATILVQKPGENPLLITSADVQGLPPELMDQLVNLPDNDKLENDIIDLINSAGGTLLLDHILIGLYRRSGEIHQRNLIVSKLYRMNKKGVVFSSPLKKGAYTTIKPENDKEGDIEIQ